MTSADTASPSPRPSWLRRHGGKLAVSLVIAAAFVWLLNAGALPFVPPRAALERVQWWTVFVYALSYCAVHLVRAARWQFLLRPLHSVPMRRVLAVSFVGFAAIVLLPIRT